MSGPGEPVMELTPGQDGDDEGALNFAVAANGARAAYLAQAAADEVHLLKVPAFTQQVQNWDALRDALQAKFGDRIKIVDRPGNRHVAFNDAPAEMPTKREVLAVFKQVGVKMFWSEYNAAYASSSKTNRVTGQFYFRPTMGPDSGGANVHQWIDFRLSYGAMDLKRAKKLP